MSTPEEPTEDQIAAARKAWKEYTDWFSRHLVCLLVTYVHLDEAGKRVGDERVATFSGFVMSFRGVWFFVTAGHALKEGIDERVATGQVKLHFVGFHDSLGSQARHQVPTLIDYESTPRWYVDDRTLGLDVGIMHLRPFYRAGLEANGIVPITEENWLHQPKGPLSNYFLLGVPDELRTPAHPAPGPTGDELQITVTPVFLPVRWTGRPHKELPPSDYPWFIGEVTPLFGVKSIVGMSGGPIFGLNNLPGGGWGYWIVALQSWWDPNSKTVYGCPLPVFGGLISGWLDEVLGDDEVAGEPPA